jgi:hypothetical protein
MLLQLAIATSARAQTCHPEWDCHQVDTPTAPGVPLMAVVQAWSPTDAVYVLWDAETVTTPPEEHQAFLSSFVCPNGDCSAASVEPGIVAEPIGTRVLWGWPTLPSMGVYGEGGANAHVRLNIALLQRLDETAPNCGSTTTDYADAAWNDNQVTNLDLAHYTVIQDDPSDPTAFLGPTLVGDLEPSPASGTDACHGHGWSSTRSQSDGRLSSCWRFSAAAGGLDEIHCGLETGGTPAYALDDLPNNNGTWIQEHMSHDENDVPERIVVLRSRESNLWNIRARLIDAGDPDLVLDTASDVDMPDVDFSSTGYHHVVWSRGSGAASVIRHAYCDDRTGCDARAEWIVRTVYAGDSALRKPQITTDGNLQLLIFQADVGTTPNEMENRVLFTCRVGRGRWIPPQVLQTPADPTFDQSILHSHWSIAVDRDDDLVHVAFVEGDQINHAHEFPSEGKVFWASRPYSAALCTP